MELTVQNVYGLLLRSKLLYRSAPRRGCDETVTPLSAGPGGIVQSRAPKDLSLGITGLHRLEPPVTCMKRRAAVSKVRRDSPLLTVTSLSFWHTSGTAEQSPAGAPVGAPGCGSGARFP